MDAREPVQWQSCCAPANTTDSASQVTNDEELLIYHLDKATEKTSLWGEKTFLRSPFWHETSIWAATWDVWFTPLYACKASFVFGVKWFVLIFGRLRERFVDGISKGFLGNLETSRSPAKPPETSSAFTPSTIFFVGSAHLMESVE